MIRLMLATAALVLTASPALAVDLPRLSGEAFAQRDAVRSNCAGLM